MARTKENNGNSISTKKEVEFFEGKVPPYSKELEMNVLGGMIVDNTLIDAVVPILNPSKNHFYISTHNRLYKAMVDMRNKNEPIDLITLTEEMKNRGELDEIGGAFTIVELASSFASIEGIISSAHKILEYWVKRDLIRINFEIREKCYDPAGDTEKLLNTAQHDILEVTNYLQKRNYSHINVEVKSTMDKMEELHERSAKGYTISGVPSGYSELDALTGGFQNSELIVLAGRPSHGKSAFALSIARNAAIDSRKNIGIFSIEMSNTELALRLICMEAQVDISELKTGRLPQEGWDKIAKHSHKLINPDTTILMDDTSPLSLLELRAKARRMRFGKRPIDMIIVDYLQLMEISNIRKIESRYIEIGYITRSLKHLSKELDIPVLALSQLSRKVEDRAGKEKRPQLSDLRESGSIEQDADVVIFINRPELYLSREEKEDEEKKAKDGVYYATAKKKLQGLAEIIVGKQRNGPVGQVDLTFIHKYARFESSSKDIEPEYYTPKDVAPF